MEIRGVYTTAKIFTDNIELECISQIRAMVNNESFSAPIKIMPDTHKGYGSVIGFTMPLTDRVIPNVIGVDIGCGMLSLEFDRLNYTLEESDKFIREEVPMGFSVHSKPIIDMEIDFPWEKLTREVENFTIKFNKRYGTSHSPKECNYTAFKNICQKVNVSLDRVEKSIGTLGGGNHFIEIGKSDVTGKLWLTIHTGSRNLGKCICNYWQKKAVRIHKTGGKWHKEELMKIPVKERESYINEIKRQKPALPKGLEPLSGEDMYHYMCDMIVAQRYASVNRDVISYVIKKRLNFKQTTKIESVHNFIDLKDFIIRKGAIKAYRNEAMIIPFNRRDGLLLCEGKSNEDWNFSAPHGAGRIMSRRRAKSELSISEFKEEMKKAGVFSTSVSDLILDEAPGAYKDSSEIEENIGDTCEIKERIKPIFNLKST